MTIKVLIQNRDSRESAIIGVQTPPEGGSWDYSPQRYTHKLGPGESAEFIVYQLQDIIIKEISQ